MFFKTSASATQFQNALPALASSKNHKTSFLIPIFLSKLVFVSLNGFFLVFLLLPRRLTFMYINYKCFYYKPTIKVFGKNIHTFLTLIQLHTYFCTYQVCTALHMYKDQQILPKLYCTMYVFFQKVVIKRGFFLQLTYITFNLVLHYYFFKYL